QPVTDLSAWLHAHAGWLPLFGSNGPYGKSVLLGSIVLAIMVLPIVTALSREVFRQTPSANEEAALALGATRWEMIRTAVLPYGRLGAVRGGRRRGRRRLARRVGGGRRRAGGDRRRGRAAVHRGPVRAVRRRGGRTGRARPAGDHAHLLRVPARAGAARLGRGDPA